MKVGIVSGYFNPIHRGHIEYINGAKDKCDFLIAIINSDDQVRVKGTIPFMDEFDRYVIVKNLKSIDDCIIGRSFDKTVCRDIEYLKNNHPNDEIFFFNSGDRIAGVVDCEEKTLCQKLGITYVELESLMKINSSSKLIKDAAVELFRRAI